MYIFETKKKKLEGQFENIEWIEASGISEKELLHESEDLMHSELSRIMIKAKTFKLIANSSRIAVDKDDIFQDKIFGGSIMQNQREVWLNGVIEKYLKKDAEELDFAWKVCGAYNGNHDFGHTSPNSELLLREGLTGILKQIEKASARNGLSEKQKEFYESCRTVYEAIGTVARRLAEAVKPFNEENHRALLNIAEDAPHNIYEAMQLLIIYFFMHEYVAGTRVRTLGRLDVLLYPFYKNDIESGKYSKNDIKNMLKFFLNKFWTAKIDYDLPFCLGGIDSEENEVTNELSYLIVETYDELNIYSPKIHIRVSEKTPANFVKQILSYIRKGNSSFVFINDKTAVKALEKVGINERDARDYVPIGCYEPAVWGKEIGCTGNGGVNLAKSVELVLNNGCDLASGVRLGCRTEKIESYEDFIDEIKRQIKFMTEKATDYIVKIEKHYSEINPDPILSGMYENSIETGIDVYEGGAKYNNSSFAFRSIASLVDCICAVKKLVFEEKIVSLEQLADILKNNWENSEELRQVAKRLPEKYGNNNPTADEIMVEMTDFCSALVNNRPNGRGGVFKAACYTIDHYVRMGERTMATPDGRRAGEILSKNLCASVAMDKCGITALINSVTKADLSKFPNGSVLDIILHPSAVSGEDGLAAFCGILMTYFKKGGFALHGNIFNADDLKNAQKEPEKYKNLQVRVCGWNAYFVKLSRTEQDAFIKQAMNG